MIRLKLEWGEELREYEFHRPQIKVGRGPINDLTVPVQGISIHHCTLSLREGVLFFKDNESLGGSFLRDAERLRPLIGECELSPGDAVMLGEHVRLTVLGAQFQEVKLTHDTFDDSATAAQLGLEACAILAESALSWSRSSDLIALLQSFRQVVESALEAEVENLSVLWLGDGFHQGRVVVLGQDGALTEESESYVLSPGLRVSMLEALKQGGLLRHPLEAGERVLLCSVLPKCRTVALVVDLKTFHERDLQMLRRLGHLILPLLEAATLEEHQQEQVSLLRAENLYFRESQRRHFLFKELVTESQAMREVYKRLNLLVGNDLPVLITGEAGCGKQLIVRALHHLGGRASGLLLDQNCAGVDESMLDVILFGAHDEAHGQRDILGIFELARGGTVYLGEVDRLTPLLQAKVLRVLKESEIRRHGESLARAVDVRLVASTHQNLEELVNQNKFRKDLYMALSAHVLHVPALRDRKEDIMPLVRNFLSVFAQRYSLPVPDLSPGLEAVLKQETWSGNVRELQRAVEVAVLRRVGRPLMPEDFGLVG